MAVGKEEKKKSFPQKSVGRRACMCVCGQSPWFFFLWLGRGGKVGGGGDTCGTVKVIRISCISTSNHPPLLLPTFRPGKNGRRMQEEYRGERLEKRSLEEHLEMVGGGSLSLHPASIFPPVWIP